jgi:hypothetical protein
MLHVLKHFLVHELGSLGLLLSTFYGTCTSLSPIVMLLLLLYCDALAFETFRLNVVVAVLLDEFISSISREKEAEKQIEEKEQQKRRITGVQLPLFVLFVCPSPPFVFVFFLPLFVINTNAASRELVGYGIY